MIVRGIDVLDRECFARQCYRLGFDKGSFTPGVGYTSYRTQERRVCMTRHLDGCPSVAVCEREWKGEPCRTRLVEGQAVCPWCHQATGLGAAEGKHHD